MQCEVVDKNISMASENKFLEKRDQQQQQSTLKCPRCDSSNTKFCYYNNYSLLQPRHFCKGCKRYWTLGGTLRNVPVGGGCRRNKRVRRPASSIDGGSSITPYPTSQPQLIVSSSSSHVNPLLNGLPGSGSRSDINFPFSRVDASGYDSLLPHLSDLGLRFSSNNLLSNYSNIFGSSGSSAPAAAPTTIASLLASTINQKKNTSYYQTLGSFQGLQMGNSGEEMTAVNVEDGQSRMEGNYYGCQNPVEQIGLSDPNVYWRYY